MLSAFCSLKKTKNMYKQILLLLFGILLLGMSSCNQKSTLSKEEVYVQKADSVLALMTLKEKIGQLNQYTGNWQATGPLVNDTTKLSKIRQGLVGSMLNIKGAENTRALQEMAMESRLQIPIIFGLDVIHGLRTIFPIPLAEAASFDMDAIERSARVAAEEASASGVHWTFAPMVDVSRDARWGRVMEGAGEDPWYGSKVAVARVKGFQGDDLSENNTIMGCAKHFAAYGAPIAGKDYNTVDMSMVNLHNNYLPPFKAVTEAGVATFMNAFNELNGIPCTGSEFLQRDILKDKWDFEGFVVSDWGSIGEMVPHGYVKDRKGAALAAIQAGSDMDMESRCYIDFLQELVESGKVSESLVDDAVRRILIKKFELGLFDDPFRYSNEQREQEKVMHPDFREAARDMGRKSVVLLKNENNILPLSENLSSVALVGPLMKSKKDMCGFWANEQWTDSVVTIWSGMKKALPEARLIYSEGYDLETGEVADIRQTVTETSRADAIVVAVGERWDDSGEAKSMGNIYVKEDQQRLVEALVKTGKPVVVLVMGGRPLIFNKIRDNAKAILFTWWLGTESGNAIADVLLGEYNPSAKLPMTFPKHIAQVPVFYNYKNTGRPENPDVGYSTKYKDIDFKPAWPFGFGLSYTSFSYSGLKIENKEVKKGSPVKVKVTVKNTGKYPGEEVVQLYIRDMVGSLTRPIKELKGFKKINLRPGESSEVSFELTSKELGFWNREGQFLVEPGEFTVMAGTNSDDYLKETFLLVE